MKLFLHLFNPSPHSNYFCTLIFILFATTVLPTTVQSQEHKNHHHITSKGYQKVYDVLSKYMAKGQKPIVCHKSDIPNKRSKQYYDDLLKQLELRNVGRADKAEFVITFVGFPEDAKVEFKKAVAIWENLISSDVKIYVTVDWTTDLPYEVLGGASPGDRYINPPGAIFRDTAYPTALAERIAGKELNEPTQPDIVASFNSDVLWSFNSPNEPESNTTNFVQVVLHELGHGLGFEGLTEGDISTETFNYEIYLSPFDYLIRNKDDESLINNSKYPNGSNALYEQFTSGELVLKGYEIDKTNISAKIYTPYPYAIGSSVYHLDQETFQNSEDELMVPRTGNADETIQPGPLTIAIFNDLGWKNSFIEHPLLRSTEDMTKPLVVTAKLRSDYGFSKEEITVYWDTEKEFTNPKEIEMVKNGDTFTATIPPVTDPNGSFIYYYLAAEDDNNRTVTSPGNIPDTYHHLFVGPDTTPPLVQYRPIRSSIFSTTRSLFIMIEAFGEKSIGKAYIEYSINGEEKTPIELTPVEPTEASIELNKSVNAQVGQVTKSFEFEWKFEGESDLKGDDELRYNIVVFDEANTPNKGYATEEDDRYYHKIINIDPAVASYENNFDDLNDDDFVSDLFEAKEEQQFSNGALHTSHPYREAGSNNRLFLHTFLKKPIIIDETNHFMNFNEVVLIEPGQNNIAYPSDNFYDYAIVEGSIDNGEFWFPLVAGYDSNDHSDWLNTFTSDLTINNASKAIGTKTLFKNRTIDLKNPPLVADEVVNSLTPVIETGYEMLIRFTLYSDQFTNGWGWAIDDLKIQTQNASGVLAVPAAKVFADLKVFPNPASNLLNVKRIPNPSKGNTLISIIDTMGKTQINTILDSTQEQLTIDTSSLKQGVYFLNVSDNKSTETIKVILE